MYYNENSIVFFNDKWVKATEAKESVYSQSLHYGNGVFEGMRSYDTPGGTRVFKIEEHYKRLSYSSEKMKLKFKYSFKEFSDIVYELLKKNNLSNSYIRPLVYGGESMSLPPTRDNNFFLAAWEWEKYLGDKPLNIMISTYRRPDPRSCHIDAKVCGHYVNSILAANEAIAKGYDEALLLDANGYVAEGPSANFFYEKQGILFTSPVGNIMPGITRATIIELARSNKFTVEECYFKPENVKNSDGAFFTGTAVEVIGIKSLEGNDFKKKWEDTLGYILSLKYNELVTEKSR